jgi:uncharacterized lipoprotein YmbA
MSLFSGCASTQRSRFYVLFPSQPKAEDIIKNDEARNAVIAIDKVKLPKHLNRPYIVTHISEYELNFSEFRRWGQDLDKNVRNVITDNISKILDSDKIAESRLAYSGEADYTVDIDVRSMSGTLGENAYLSARWRISKKGEEKSTDAKTGKYSVELKDSKYSSYIIAQSGMLADLSKDIAAAISDVTAKPKSK